MIEFQLDETSGVATYLQLVQQVVAQLAPFGASGGPGPRRHRGDLPHRLPGLLRRGGRMTAVIAAPMCSQS